jgi:hypothetical protein
MKSFLENKGLVAAAVKGAEAIKEEVEEDGWYEWLTSDWS